MGVKAANTARVVSRTPVSAFSTSRAFRVLMLKLDTGERLPCLIDAATWLPARVATRWAVRYRRFRVQSSTLAGDLRVLARVYAWAEYALPGGLDDHLVSGAMLGTRETQALTTVLRQAARVRRPAASTDEPALLNGPTYDHHLGVVEDFLTWAADPGNRGGASAGLDFGAVALRREQIRYQFRTLRVGGTGGTRIEPLSADEARRLRACVLPEHGADGRLRNPVMFKNPVFTEPVQLRNALMVLLAVELGLRRGELLKLRLDSLPIAGRDDLAVRRLADDPHDSRQREPLVKTAERLLPMPPLLRVLARVYLTGPEAMRRPSGRSPYLFVTASGMPLSIAAADEIILAVRRATGIRHLRWHTLRHTWAESTAEALASDPQATEKLQYLGGWTNASSVHHYTRRAIARAAETYLQDRHAVLYGSDEHRSRATS